MMLHFFRVPWILDGPWYQVLLTNFVLLSLVFLFGLWSGLIFRRFGLVGAVVAYAAVTLVVVVAVMLITWQQAWPRLWQFLVDLDITQRQPAHRADRGGGVARRLPDDPADHRLIRAENWAHRETDEWPRPDLGSRPCCIQRDQAGPGTLTGSFAPDDWAARAMK